MTSDTKVGLLVGLGVILLAGILISDHYSVVRRQSPAQMVTDLPELKQDLLPDPPAIRSRQNRVNALIESLAAPNRNATYNGPLTIHAPGPNETQAQQTQESISQTPQIVWMNTQQGSGEQQILIPGVAPQPPAPARRLHTVVEGDRLASLARQYYGDGKHWQKIFDANRSVLLSPDALQPGMKLEIPMDAVPVVSEVHGRAAEQPVALAQATTTYEVRESESLSEIAQRFYGSQKAWPRLFALNKDVLTDPDHLQPGMVIRVPARR